jgi:hypothetical protein
MEAIDVPNKPTCSPFHAASDVNAGSYNMCRFSAIRQTTSQSHAVKVDSHIDAMCVQAEN